VDLTADVSGTATGDIIYSFDCTSDGTWEHSTPPIPNDPYTAQDLCDYSSQGTYTAKAKVERGGFTAECTTQIDVSAPINYPPNTPELRDPPHNTWINYDPTFKAKVTDPNTSDTLRAIFQILGYATSPGDWVSNGSNSSLGPVNLGSSCFENWWQAQAEDNSGLKSDWTGYWYVKVDKDKPSSSISYPTGTINYETFTVTLTESDGCSGITEGDVDISINGGAWQDYASRIDDFNYTGVNGNSYQFRYRVKDNAGNWSDFAVGGTVTIQLPPANRPPSATNLKSRQGDYCVTRYAHVYLSWTFTDPDQGDYQTAYQVQVDNNSNFSSPESDSGKVISGSQEHSPLAGKLSYNTTYYWRLKVWDSKDLSSDWILGPQFTTPKHAYPNVDFSWDPTRPYPGEPTLFTDQSICYDDEPTYGSGCSQTQGKIDSFFWTFEEGTPPTSNEENPTVTFSTRTAKDITLQVTDSDSFSCSKTKTLFLTWGLPKWKEINPAEF
jgi:hypothetical protein